MPKYIVSGVDKTSGQASKIELSTSDRVTARQIAELEHNLMVRETLRIDMPDRIKGLGGARFFLVLWLIADALAALISLVNLAHGTGSTGIVLIALIPGVAIPLSLRAILNGVEQLLEKAEELR